MLKLIKIIITPLLLTTIVFTPSAFADFNIKGEGSLTYPTGLTKPFNFGFGWNESTKKFRIGNKSYAMDQIPDSYSIALAISKDGKTIWVQEFADGFFEEFDWKIGSHHIQLRKKTFKQKVLGNYVLLVNDTRYIFVSRTSSIDIKFNTEGIKGISIGGVTKDFDTKNNHK